MATAWPTVCSRCQQVGCNCAKTINSKPQRATRRMYNRRWVRQRASFINENPLCVACENVGRVRPAAEVDHVVPHRGNEVLFWDVNNWQALCKRCHSRKTVREGNTGRRVGVCGQPSAGKTTYVEKNSFSTDVVFDWDKIAAAVVPGEKGQKRAENDLFSLFEAMREACVIWANSGANNRNLWLICTNRERAKVLAERMGGELVDLDGPTPGKGGQPGF